MEPSPQCRTALLWQFRYSNRQGCPELWVSKAAEASEMLCEEASCNLLAMSGIGAGTAGGNGSTSEFISVTDKLMQR